MGRKDLRKVTQRKPKTKGKGDELIDWTIKDLDRRNKNLQQQLELYSKQLLHGMDATPSEVSQPKRRGNVKQPSQEEKWRKEEEDFAKQQAEWNEANEAQVNPIPPDLRTSDAFNPDFQEGIMFDRRPSDQELRLNEYAIELAQKHAKLDAEGAYTINNLRELFMNSDPSYNRSLNDLAADVSGKFYSTPANKEDATGNEPASNTPAALNNQVAEQDVSDSYQDSGEQDHYQSEVEAREAEQKHEDQSFLTKSNNAAAKSGAFKDEELLALRDKHRSGEWRNKSNVDTGSKAGANIAKENLQR